MQGKTSWRTTRYLSIGESERWLSFQNIAFWGDNKDFRWVPITTPMKLIDLHQDLLLSERQHHSLSSAQTNFTMLERADVRVVVSTGFADVEPADDPSANDWIEEDLAFFAQHCVKNPSWRIIKTAGDLQAALHGDARGILCHIEGLNALPERAELFNTLERWHGLGLRSIGPLWNVNNVFGGGTKDPERTLTPIGRELIDWCEVRNIVLDLAHMNEPTFWDALAASSRPPFISHAGMRALVDSPRNLSDEQLRAIAKRGGVVGIYVSRGFIAPHLERSEFMLDAVAKHLEHAVAIMGVDHIALGTDYGGILSGTPADAPTIADIGALFDLLRKRTWSEDAIEKIAHKNTERVLAAHLG